MPKFSWGGTLPWPKDNWEWLQLRLPLSTHSSDRGGGMFLSLFGSHCNTGPNAKRVPSQFVTNDLDSKSGTITFFLGTVGQPRRRRRIGSYASQLITPFTDLHQSHQAPFRLCHVPFLSLPPMYSACLEHLHWVFFSCLRYSYLLHISSPLQTNQFCRN